MRSLGTMLRPKGKHVTGIILILAIASGIPTMVTCLARSGNNVANRQPKAGDEEPDEVADGRKTTCAARRLDYAATEWPQGITRHSEASNTSRNGHNQQARDNACEKITGGQHKTAKNEPNYVQY